MSDKSNSTYERVFEIHRRDGHSTKKIFEASDLEELARFAGEKSGVNVERPEIKLTDGGEK